MVLLSAAVLGIAISTQTSHLITTILTFCAAAVGLVVVQPIFWVLPTTYLNGRAAAVGIAFIGSVGNLGGPVAPTFKAAAEKRFGSQIARMLFLCSIALGGILLLAWIKRGPIRSNNSTNLAADKRLE